MSASKVQYTITVQGAHLPDVPIDLGPMVFAKIHFRGADKGRRTINTRYEGGMFRFGGDPTVITADPAANTVVCIKVKRTKMISSSLIGMLDYLLPSNLSENGSMMLPTDLKDNAGRVVGYLYAECRWNIIDKASIIDRFSAIKQTPGLQSHQRTASDVVMTAGGKASQEFSSRSSQRAEQRRHNPSTMLPQARMLNAETFYSITSSDSNAMMTTPSERSSQASSQTTGSGQAYSVVMIGQQSRLIHRGHSAPITAQSRAPMRHASSEGRYGQRYPISPTADPPSYDENAFDARRQSGT